MPIGDAVNANLACVTTFMCHPDEDVALARGLEGANFFGYSLAHYYVFGNHAPGRTNVWEEFLAQRGEKGYSPEAVEAAREHGDRLGAKVVQERRATPAAASSGCAARSARPTRCASTSAATRRPASTR